jgi:hypothetical protein
MIETNSNRYTLLKGLNGTIYGVKREPLYICEYSERLETESPIFEYIAEYQQTLEWIKNDLWDYVSTLDRNHAFDDYACYNDDIVSDNKLLESYLWECLEGLNMYYMQFENMSKDDFLEHAKIINQINKFIEFVHGL